MSDDEDTSHLPVSSRLDRIVRALCKGEGISFDDATERIWKLARSVEAAQAALDGDDGEITYSPEVTVDEPDPIEESLREWMADADLWLDGRRTRRGINLVGNAATAKIYAHLIAERIAAYGHDVAALAEYLVDPDGARKYVRVPAALAPQVAEGVIHHLEREGLL